LRGQQCGHCYRHHLYQKDQLVWICYVCSQAGSSVSCSAAALQNVALPLKECGIATKAALNMSLPPACCPLLLQGRAAASFNAGAPSTAAIAPNKLYAAPQQQQLCLSEHAAAAAASAQCLQGSRSVPLHPEQRTTGVAGTQHSHQANTGAAAVAAAAAAAAAGMSQDLTVLPVQLAGQHHTAHPNAALMAVQRSAGLPATARHAAASDMPMLEAGWQGKSVFSVSGAGIRLGSVHTGAGGVATGVRAPSTSARGGLPSGGFWSGLSAAPQVCTQAGVWLGLVRAAGYSRPTA
jgi:hypothetical protein